MWPAMAAWAIPAVEVPMSTWQSGYSRRTVSAMACSTRSRTWGAVRMSRLSQYTGLWMPLAQVKGSSGRKNTARMDKRSRAILCSVVMIFFLSVQRAVLPVNSRTARR